MDVAWLQLDTPIGALSTHFGPLQVVWQAGNSWKVYRTCDSGISYMYVADTVTQPLIMGSSMLLTEPMDMGISIQN
jgi:hypothetical protein